MSAATGLANRRTAMAECGSAQLTLLDERGAMAWMGLGHRLASLLGVRVNVTADGQRAHVQAASGLQRLLDAVHATNPESTVVERVG